MHLLDFGPANGADVTANIMEAAPGRQVLQRNLSMADVHAQQQADGPALPYLYCGQVLEPLDSPVVQKVRPVRQRGSQVSEASAARRAGSQPDRRIDQMYFSSVWC